MESKKKITITVIADMLGVSPSTVSRAFDPKSRISDTVRKKILDTAKELDFVPNKAASRLSMNEITIGIILTNIYNVAINEFVNGIKEGYDSLKDYKIHYDIKILDSKEKEKNFVTSFIDFRSYDGLIVSGFFGDEACKLLNGYIECGGNVALLQTDITDVKGALTVQHNSEISADLAAEFISLCLRGKKKKNVLLFTGDQKTSLHLNAAKKFKESAERYGMNIVGIYDMEDDSSVLKSQIDLIYKKQKLRPDAVYITSGISLELFDFLYRKGLADSTVVVGTDIYDEICGYLRNGVIDATIYQDLRMQATIAFKALAEKIMREKVSDILPPPPVLVLNGNLPYYEKNYKE